MSSSNRRWWLFAGGLLVAVVVLTALERLVGTPPAATAATDDRAREWPAVRRLEDGAIEIREGRFGRTTIRLDSEAEQRALFECVASGFDRAFGGGRASGLGHGEIRAEAGRIRERCMRFVAPGMLPPPRP